MALNLGKCFIFSSWTASQRGNYYHLNRDSSQSCISENQSDEDDICYSTYKFSHFFSTLTFTYLYVLLETSWKSEIPYLKQPSESFAFEQDFEANKEVSEYETLDLKRKMSNFEIVSFGNKKLLGQLQEIETRRRNLALMTRQHRQEEDDLMKKIQFKCSRGDIRFSSISTHFHHLSYHNISLILYELYLRKYQSFVEQIETLLMLRNSLKSQLNSTENKKLAEKIRLQIDEANMLKSHQDKRKKYLEQKMKEHHLEKSFSSFVNMKEMICLEVKNCNKIEKHIFEQLNYKN